MTQVVIPYQPLQSQGNFHRCQSLVKCLLGGVGSGKTAGGAYEAVKHALGQPGRDGMIVAPTYAMLKRVTLPAFLSALPEECIKNHNKGDRVIILHNNSKIWYASADNYAGLDGPNLAWWWLDEGRYAHEEAYNRLLARLRQPGALIHQGFVTTTPEMNWLYDEFDQSGNPERTLIYAPTIDNIHLPEWYIDQLRDTYSESMFEMYVMGRFVHLTGGVFPQFRIDEHVCPLHFEPRIPVCAAVDFGYREPAVIYFQHIPVCHYHKTTDCIHIIDEDMPDNCDTTKLSKLMAAKYKKMRWRKGPVFVDPAGDNNNVTVGYNDISVLKSEGFYNIRFITDPAKTFIPYGIDRIRLRLRPYGSAPTLYIKEGLNGPRGVIKALQMSKYPDKSKGYGSNHPVKKGGVEHARDALRYLVIGLESGGVSVI